jgi:hypothetical protein
LKTFPNSGWFSINTDPPQRVACLVDQIRFINPADEQAMQASLEPNEAKECGATTLDSTSSQDANNKTDSL